MTVKKAVKQPIKKTAPKKASPAATKKAKGGSDVPPIPGCSGGVHANAGLRLF